jgi:hypothetical protein
MHDRIVQIMYVVSGGVAASVSWFHISFDLSDFRIFVQYLYNRFSPTTTDFYAWHW